MNRIFCPEDERDPDFIEWREIFEARLAKSDGMARPFRGLDTKFVYDALEVNQHDRVLELGGMMTWSFEAFANPFDMPFEFIVSDDLSWAKRPYFAGEGLDLDAWISDVNEAGEDVRFESIDAHNVGQRFPKAFDKIYAISVIEHFEYDLIAMNSIREALADGGRFALTTEVNLFESKAWNAGDFYRVYKIDGLFELIEASGFEMVGDLVIPSSREMIDGMARAIRDPLILERDHTAFSSVGMLLKKRGD